MSLPPTDGTPVSSDPEDPSTPIVDPTATLRDEISDPTSELEKDPAPNPEPPTRRIPNLGHALLFVTFTGFLLLAFQLALILMGKSPASIENGAIKVLHPRLQLASEAATYLVALTAAWLFYPVLWRRSFLSGIRWNWAAARSQFGKLAALGLLLGLMMQAITYFITPPKTLPIDNFFLTPIDAWLITFFGTIVAPIFEEICFRGFLVPAFAIAYDWLALPRTEAARAYWQTTTALTPGSLIFSAVLSSILFAGLHAQQVAHMGTALLLLFSVSLVLTFVRNKTQSVAASTIVHGAYNGFVFLTVFISTSGYRHLDRMTK